MLLSLSACTKDKYEEQSIIEVKNEELGSIIVSKSLYNYYLNDKDSCYQLIISKLDSFIFCQNEFHLMPQGTDKYSTKLYNDKIKICIGFGGPISKFNLKVITDGTIDEIGNLKFIMVRFNIRGANPAYEGSWTAKLERDLFYFDITSLDNSNKIKSVDLIDYKTKIHKIIYK